MVSGWDSGSLSDVNKTTTQGIDRRSLITTSATISPTCCRATSGPLHFVDISMLNVQCLLLSKLAVHRQEKSVSHLVLTGRCVFLIDNSVDRYRSEFGEQHDDTKSRHLSIKDLHLVKST